MMTDQRVQIADAEVELLVAGETFLGFGEARIKGRVVRSGRLPASPMIQTFSGLELVRMELVGVDMTPEQALIRTRAIFQPMATKLMRDHSFDPIHDTSDWDGDKAEARGELDLILRPVTDVFGDVMFTGFSYAWRYHSDDTPIFFILDRASWELDGNINGATAVSQSSCSDPVVTFDANNGWSTEGFIHWQPDIPNPVMTHNLPRWASHGSFDWQHKDEATLLGVFERVGLIRSLLKRESGKAELKCFDKHLFDQTLQGATIPKAILLNTEPKGEVDQRNLWTWVTDAVHERARQEFNLRDTSTLPCLAFHFWDDFTVKDYGRDLLPAAESLGIRQIYVDNLKKSAMTEDCPNPGKFHWNMCCGHEYEISPSLGGEAGVRHLIEDATARGIQVMSWTNNAQALSSPMNEAERDDSGWYVKLEDTRQKFGGAYAGVMSVLDLSNDEARDYFVQSHIAIKDKTGLAGYLFDSFYNLGFMPVTYAGGEPRTMWRGCLSAIKAMQDAGIEWLIESFGPFGQPQHGCPRSYNIEHCWICYRIGLGNDYTTVPSGPTHDSPQADDAAALYYVLAHKTVPPLALFKDGQRIDQRFVAAHRRALADYHAALPNMHRRYLQEDDRSVVWHDRHQRIATIFSFADQSASLNGEVKCISSGQEWQASESVSLQANQTYQVRSTRLPISLNARPTGHDLPADAKEISA